MHKGFFLISSLLLPLLFVSLILLSMIIGFYSAFSLIILFILFLFLYFYSQYRVIEKEKLGKSVLLILAIIIISAISEFIISFLGFSFLINLTSRLRNNYWDRLNVGTLALTLSLTNSFMLIGITFLSGICAIIFKNFKKKR